MPVRGFSRRKSTVVVVATAVIGLLVTGAAIAATFSLTSSDLGVGQVTTPVLYADPLTLTDKGGAGHQVGRADAGDKITVVYSRVLTKTSFCTGWGGTNPQFDIDGNKAAGSSGNDTLTLDQSTPNVTCTGGFHFGSIDMGSTGYFTSAASVDFNKSTAALTTTPTTSKLVITLGTIKAGTVGVVNSSQTATLTPDPALSDAAGHVIGSNICAHTGVLF